MWQDGEKAEKMGRFLSSFTISNDKPVVIVKGIRL